MKLPIMIVVIVLSSFAIMASAQPVSTNAPPPLSEQGALQTRTIQTTEATIQKLEAQVSGTNPQNEEQPQPGIPNIPAPHGGSHFLPFLQYYPWSPVGGSPLMIPMQMSGQGSQPSNQATLPQQPLIFPPYGYFPLLSPPYRNQLVSPYGFPMTFDAPLPQIPANNPPISPQTPSGSGPAVKSPQPSQQTQNLPVVYMLQQPVNSLLGGLSSEELEMAARAGQLSLYLSAVQTAQRMSQDTSNPAQPAFQQPSPVVLPTAGITSTGVSKAHGLHPERGSEALSKTHAIPAGLEKAGQAAATIQAPAQNQNRQAAQPCLRPHAPNKN